MLEGDLSQICFEIVREIRKVEMQGLAGEKPTRTMMRLHNKLLPRPISISVHCTQPRTPVINTTRICYSLLWSYVVIPKINPPSKEKNRAAAAWENLYLTDGTW